MKTAAPNPLRTLGAFLASKARLLTAARDEGGLFELRFMARLLGRGQAAVTEAAATAREIHTEATSLRDFVLESTSPTDDTPGQLDHQESAHLLSLLTAHAHTTRHHSGQMEFLL